MVDCIFLLIKQDNLHQKLYIFHHNFYFLLLLSDGLTKQLGLQAAQKEPEHDLKMLSAQELNKSYQGLQQQVQQARNPQQKSELKNQLHEVHLEISKRTQKQLQDFAKQNPKIKQPDPEPDQSLKR